MRAKLDNSALLSDTPGEDHSRVNTARIIDVNLHQLFFLFFLLFRALEQKFDRFLTPSLSNLPTDRGNRFPRQVFVKS